MNPNLRHILFSGPGNSTGGTSTAVQRVRGVGMNLDWPYGSCYTSFFTDLMKQTGGFLPPPGSSVDANGWPINVTAGSSIRFFIYTGLGYSGYAAFRPGTYKARMDAAHTSAGWTCQFEDSRSSGITTIGPRASTATVTVNDLGTDGDYSGLTLNLVVYAPNSGGPYSLSGLQIFKQEHQTWLDSGTYYSIFDPDFLGDLQGSNIKCIRVKDWLGIDNATFEYGYGYLKRGVLTYSELVKESSRTWQMPTNNGPFGGNVPYAVCAKLARYLNCGLLLSVPLLDNSVAYDTVTASTDTITGVHLFTNGDQITFDSPAPSGLAAWTPYYVRDVVATVPNNSTGIGTPGSFKVSASFNGTPIDLTADYTRGSSDFRKAYQYFNEATHTSLYQSIANECYTAAPGIDVIVDAGNECWNGADPYGYAQCANCLSAHTASPPSFADVAHGYAWALLRAWSAFETYYPRDQVIRIFQGQTVSFGAMADRGYDYVDATLYPGQKVADLIDAHCTNSYVYGSFKAGQNNAGLSAIGLDFIVNYRAASGSDWYSAEAFVVGDRVHMTDGNEYVCIANHTNRMPPNAPYWSLVTSTALTGLGPSWTDDQMLNFGIRCNANAAFYQADYKTKADAKRTNPTAAGYIMYEGGPIWGNAPNSTAMAARMALWMKTTQFQSYIQDFVNTVLIGSGVTTHNEYIGAGQWRVNASNDAVLFGLKRAHHLPDTPAYAWYKSATL